MIQRYGQLYRITVVYIRTHYAEYRSYIIYTTAVYSLWLGNLYGTVKQHNIEYRLRAQTV